MLKIRRRTARAVSAVALACLIGFSTAAVASGSPTLARPKPRAHVGPGAIRIVVRDTEVLPRFSVFVQISPRRRLNQWGHLAKCLNVNRGCDFVELKHWKGHPGMWIWTNRYPSFPGYWATTPHRYYWQAFHVNCFVTRADDCHVTSAIHVFHVR